MTFDVQLVTATDISRPDPAFAGREDAGGAGGVQCTMANDFIRSLAAFAGEHLLAEKILVAPSRRVGNQWLDQVARLRGGVLNVRVATLRSLAVELSAPLLAAEGLRVAPHRAELLLAGRVLRSFGPDGPPYFGRSTPALAESLLGSLDDLFGEGIPLQRLRGDLLEDESKALALREMASRQKRGLQELGLAHYSRVLILAARRLASEPEALGRGSLVLVPADLRPSHLERRLLETLPPGRLHRLPVDPPGLPGRIEFRRAVGAENELRLVLRSCLEEGIPLDQVELLYADPTHALLAVETFASLNLPEGDAAAEAPLTFAEGLPCLLSRPGRALLGWLGWIADGHPQGRLVSLLRQGVLSLDPAAEGAERVGHARLAAILRSLPVGRGLERYLPVLDQRLAALKADLAAPMAADGGEEGVLPEEPEVRRSRLEHALGELEVLRSLASRLADISALPPENAGGGLLAAARRFLADCARGVGAFDAFARQRLSEELEEMALWLERTGGGSTAEVLAWLEALPGETRVGGSGPLPGCLHAAPLRTGGHSGRPHTFLVGLEEGRFPGGGLQDPLLLDHERARLSPRLPTAGRHLEERVEDFRRLLGRLRGRATLVWPCREVVDDAPRFPSQVVLEAFRLARGAPGADPQDLDLAAGLPASFAPPPGGQPLDAGEWWLRRLTSGPPVTDPQELLTRHAPHLARGIHAALVRSGEAFTPWDGRVPQAGLDLDPSAPGGKVLSANGLEIAGACPRRFFLRYALELDPPEELDPDPERWLDPLATGSLLHELFEEYVREIIRTGWPADFNRGRSLILNLLEAKLTRYRALHPVVNPAAYASERERLVLAAETLVREEERHALLSGSEPVWLEASLGMPPGPNATELDTPEPVPVPLPGGGRILARGRVDRIDRAGGPEGGYVIWDYKTGGTWGFDPADPFPEGRKIQPYLYLRMVEHRLTSMEPRARVLSFGYFFPGTRGRGERMIWDAARLSRGGEVLALLCSLIAGGAFPGTTDAKDCRFCDYRPACGDLAAGARSAAAKVLAGDPLLVPLSRLRAASLVRGSSGEERT
jgi:ATP-dependent helicase/nuclease subunit B